MSCLDQGMSSHIVANVFVECMDPWGRNQADRTAELERRIGELCYANKDAAKIQGKLTFERLKTSNYWPKLKAKAAATRHMATFALELAVAAERALHPAAAPATKLHAWRRRAVCQLLVRFYTLLRIQGRYFTRAATEEIQGLGAKLRTIYIQLADEAMGLSFACGSSPPNSTSSYTSAKFNAWCGATQCITGYMRTRTCKNSPSSSPSHAILAT